MAFASTVTDRGIGIPSGDLARIFTRFGRADNARSRGVAGSGVGLYIAAKIVDGHGGRLEVRSEEGRGSTFAILLPRCEPVTAGTGIGTGTAHRRRRVPVAAH